MRCSCLLFPFLVVHCIASGMSSDERLIADGMKQVMCV
jgi:hypothetical protein